MAESRAPTLRVGEKTVTAAGTAVAIGSDTVRTITIVAKDGNTGQVYIGGSTVASTTNDGLAPGDSFSHRPGAPFDLADLYVDADVNGEGVDYYAETV